MRIIPVPCSNKLDVDFIFNIIHNELLTTDTLENLTNNQTRFSFYIWILVGKKITTQFMEEEKLGKT